MHASLRIMYAVTMAASRLALAQDTPHDHAKPAEQLGSVHFETSCKAAVAPQFDRAVALLHSFEFGAAISGFGAVLAADSTCAMAHWGIAMSRWTNPMAAGNRSPALLAQGKQAADAAARLAANATERERMYVAAVGELYRNVDRLDQRTRISNYEHAMASLAKKFPADTEAQIFYAIALSAAASPMDKTYAKQLQAAAILEPIFAKRPTHPGVAHYLIHTYDVPALAPKAAKAAQRYASIAPSAAHALHMPSHTFTRIGKWEASIATNRKSMEAAQKEGSIAEALHAADYTIYALLQLRRDAEAEVIVDRLPGLAERFDPNAITGAAPGSAGVFAIAAIPARYALERNDWNAAAALGVKSSAFPWADAMSYFARALGAAHLGELSSARIAIDSLASIRDRLAKAGEAYWSEQVAIQCLGAQAWLALAEHRNDEALAQMKEAATRENATEKNAVTPGPLAPASELLGDMLLELGRPKEALAQYRATLKREPNRRRALDGVKKASRS